MFSTKFLSASPAVGKSNLKPSPVSLAGRTFGPSVIRICASPSPDLMKMIGILRIHLVPVNSANVFVKVALSTGYGS